MFIIPVLDLLNGRVVQAVRGERERYRPVQSVLTSTSEPLQVAKALEGEFGCDTVYVADLDAIQEAESHLDLLRRLADDLAADLWVDAGVTDVGSALRVLNAGVERVIIGSETVLDLATLEAMHDAIPRDRLLFSLDVASGKVVSRALAFTGTEPLNVVDLLTAEGWSDMIVLTLDRVGTGGGLDWALLEAIRSRFPELMLIAGGGVRSPEDLRTGARLGLDGMLVATALHRGWITRADLETLSLGS